MPRFSANISMLFEERDWLDRPRAAAAAGFRAIEIQFPYSYSAAQWAGAVAGTDLAVAVINLPVGDMLTGGPGLAAMPGREAEFDRAIESARHYAEVLGPMNVNVLAGMPPADVPAEACWATLARNLSAAAAAFDPMGVRVVVEAVNDRDRPGYFLTDTAAAIAAIDRAGHANLAIQHDLYHMQIMEGDLIETLRRCRDRIGHIQFADTPGRHQPGTGEINFATVFDAIDGLEYDGWVGAEYVPTGRTEDSLAWLDPWR